jgi:hypothetical protein
VKLLLAGVMIVTFGGCGGLMMIVFVSEPNAFTQVIVIVFAPSGRFTVTGLVAAEPLTVQVIGGVPVTVHATEIVEVVVVVPFAGEVIVITGAVPRFTVTVAEVVPPPFVQETVIALAPITSVAGLFVVVTATPFCAHVVPDGIVVLPFTVNVTATLEAVVLLPVAGDVIVTGGGTRRVTLTTAVPVPALLVHETLIALLPATSATEFV